MKKVAVVMGSTIDLEVLSPGIELLRDLGIEVDVKILSAHKTPHETLAFGAEAVATEYAVIIAGAGGAAHLPGMLASTTRLPVIGIPIGITKLNGVDSLYSMAQMPPGTPVATVGVDASVNAALLAARILAIDNPTLAHEVDLYQLRARDAVLASQADIE